MAGLPFPNSPVYIDSTKRAYQVAVNHVLAEEDGYHTFGINHQEVNACVVRLMGAMQTAPADVAIAAVAVVLLMMVERWSLSIGSLFRFTDAFLYGTRDDKTAIVALQRFLAMMYKEHVTRTEQVKFKNSVRIS